MYWCWRTWIIHGYSIKVRKKWWDWESMRRRKGKKKSHIGMDLRMSNVIYGSGCFVKFWLLVFLSLSVQWIVVSMCVGNLSLHTFWTLIFPHYKPNTCSNFKLQGLLLKFSKVFIIILPLFSSNLSLLTLNMKEK